jgi:hypothetical protein
LCLTNWGVTNLAPLSSPQVTPVAIRQLTDSTPAVSGILLIRVIRAT